ncbi:MULTISPECIES: lactate permease LctP family transporter [unclassified Pseudomonas]|uniref:lactate permease LctP family transporter n=1 Tax=unclassified Pseudomonas TaxID=196821 RepID=UPI001944C03C|nr:MULTISPECIES: lactate permease LctP family transporter [unclassified Pseudomonas]MDC0687810.1 lactate permease LctP family transporter [Mitsuaria sp. RG]MCE0916478.1 lactate permease LctP family transporter [Pseudomonas sp. NMI760_13]MCF1487246.1 lactate permease LctP family transporter [Pseudomonas sp. AA27]MCP8633877.1 lactate permease LctP family transporter [Pseudomonas sp. DVZ6]MDD7784737.1 lactate permease LctP family transporter [Pseudomonas sp. DVZ24]
MQTWQQLYTPLGSLGLSALAAVIPIVFFFLALAVFRLKGHVAGSITLALSILVAIFAFQMPVDMALAAAGYGFLYGLWPIAWIIVAAVFLYKLTVKSGQFEVIRSSVLSITDDQRLQVLLIGFCFGAFLEGAAGFGAPVAITAALLVGLGFNPLYAAGLCLIANTAPVAFGALGIPIIVAGQVTGIDAFHIGAMTGRQLPLLSLFVPFWLVFMMDGVRGVKETWPAALVAGLSFAVTQYFTSNFIGPELPDITSALASLIALTLFLKVWQPKRSFAEAKGSVGAAVVQSGGSQPSPYSFGEIFKAWSPFLILTVLVTIWTLKPFKAAFAPGGAMYNFVFNFAIPHLDQLVIKTAPIVTAPTAMPAVFKLDPISATGTAIFLSALISMWVLKINFKTGLTTFKETFWELRWPILSIGMVLAFAFVTNYSGMSSTMALVLAGTGAAFPFFSPFLGWLGVFLTGSDTSSNALFSSLQATTAHQIGVSDTLLVAANTSGGVTGKMISPQSIAVACAATGLVGKESDLFRFTVKHSLFFATIVGLITLVQAYWLTGMLVHH